MVYRGDYPQGGNYSNGFLRWYGSILITTVIMNVRYVLDRAGILALSAH